MMAFLIENWFFIVAGICMIGAAVVLCFEFFGMPTTKQAEKVKEWLLLAVTEAEKELGGGTGQLKLRYVYDMFLMRFSWMAKVIPFQTFSDWVDEALEKMRDMLKNNEAVADLVKGEAHEG